MTVGISLTLHFCNGQLTCFSLLGNDDLCCHADSPENNHCNTVCSDNCCSTSLVNITLDTDFTFESVDSPNVQFSLTAEDVHSQYTFVDPQAVTWSFPSGEPPNESGLYLLNSSFIFYG